MRDFLVSRHQTDPRPPSLGKGEVDSSILSGSTTRKSPKIGSFHRMTTAIQTAYRGKVGLKLGLSALLAVSVAGCQTSPAGTRCQPKDPAWEDCMHARKLGRHPPAELIYADFRGR